MIRGLYAAASGMIAEQNITDTIANNIANANTVGFKQETPTFRALHGMALSRLTNGSGRGPSIGELGMGVSTDKVYTDWQTGPLAHTNNPLDVSLGDNQFFTVQTPQGMRYTRAGNFQMDGAGNLLSGSGLPVLDINGRPINAAGQTNIAIDPQGNLTANNQPLTRLRIVQADPNQMTREGDNLFAPTTPAAVLPAANPVVRPETLEQANVNPVLGMVQMITVSRSFDMAQRALTTQDTMLGHAANDIGHM